MSDIKCPFCQQELETWAKYTDGTSKLWCSKCNLFGDSRLFSEHIRIRKALDVAVDALNQLWDACDNSDDTWTGSVVKQALEQITALEQKE